MLKCARMRSVGLFAFAIIMAGSSPVFGQLPNDMWTPLHHLGRTQGIGWGDGYHSCPTTQGPDISKSRLRHSTSWGFNPAQLSAAPALSAPKSSSWLPASSVSTLHSRPSEPIASMASSVPFRFRTETGNPTNASSDHSIGMNASNEHGIMQRGGHRASNHGAMEAKCGPLFGFCPENTPLFGQLAPRGQDMPSGQAVPVGQAAPVSQATPVGQAGVQGQSGKLGPSQKLVLPNNSAPHNSATNVRIPESR